MMDPLYLETERTILKPFKKTDVELFHSLNTDPFIRKFIWDNEIISFDLANEIMEMNERYFKENLYGIWKIYLKSNPDVIGYTGLWFFFNEPQPQLIYAILKPYTKKGLATECASKIIDYAFRVLGFDYLIAATDTPHKDSQQVAKRIGMKFIKKRIENKKPTLFYRIDK